MMESCLLGDNTCYEIGGFRWEYMGYYCNECKKTISDEEFFYSMNSKDYQK
jgi:hypothetical protein